MLIQTRAAHLHGSSLEEAFTRHQNVLGRKPFLKEVYHEWFDFIISHLKPGKTLEVGAGNGSFKTYYPEVISSDVEKAPWIDILADATALPYDAESLDNIVGIDVLHHIAEPHEFFKEAARTLKPGGRVIFVEPLVTPFSYFVRKFFHHEQLDMTRLTLFDKDGKHAMEGNLAIPTLIFCTGNPVFKEGLEDFDIQVITKGEILAYLFSGGITKPAFLPYGILKLMRSAEKRLPFLNSLMATKLFIVLEKRVR